MTMKISDLPLLSVEMLRELAEGSAVVTHGVIWVKTSPDYWYCATASADRKVRDNEWLSKVAKLVIWDVEIWNRAEEYSK